LADAHFWFADTPVAKVKELIAKYDWTGIFELYECDPKAIKALLNNTPPKALYHDYNLFFYKSNIYKLFRHEVLSALTHYRSNKVKNAITQRDKAALPISWSRIKTLPADVIGQLPEDLIELAKHPLEPILRKIIKAICVMRPPSKLDIPNHVVPIRYESISIENNAADHPSKFTAVIEQSDSNMFYDGKLVIPRDMLPDLLEEMSSTDKTLSVLKDHKITLLKNYFAFTEHSDERISIS
jgi:hypothetical protein